MSGNAVLGMYQGTVSNNVDPLNEARVTMLIPQLLGNAESAWAMPSSPTNTVPPVGQTLWVQFSGGDITKPVYSPLGIKSVQDQLDGLGLVTKEPPKQPTGLALTTTPYTGPEGSTVARVQASWTPPTENQDGTPLTDLSHYLLQISYDGSTWVGGMTTEDTVATFDGLHTGANVTVRVQAIDTSGNTSLWSTATILTASSSTPPPVPSAPGVVGVLAGLRVTWDGKDNTGNPMPAWFDHVQVQRDTTNAFASPVTVATLTGPDFIYDSVQNYANAYFYRLVAYSKTGFASAASSSSSGTAQQAVATDILNGAITAAQIAVGAINSSALAAGAVNAAAIAAGAVQAGALASQAVQTVNIAPGAVTNAQIANATIGSAQIANGAIGSAQIANAAVGNAQIGNLDAGKITTGTLSASLIATGSLNASVIAAGTITGSLIQAGTITGSLLQANTITANQIATGTITANQMAAGTITASSGIIASIDATKITVGKITATQIDATNLQVAAANVTGQLTASQINASGLTISGSQVSGAVASASSATTVTGSIGSGVSVPGAQVSGTVASATSATSAGSATTVTGSIGAGVTIPPTQMGSGQIPTSTTISGGSIVTGSITAGALAAGSVTAAAIAAGSVDTSKLVVSSTGSNLLPDGSFEGPQGAALVATAPSQWWALDTTKGGNNSATAVRVSMNNGSTAATTDMTLIANMAVSAGDQYYLQVDYAASVFTGTGSLKLYARWMNSTGGTTGFGVLQITPTTDGVWRTASTTVTIPAGTTKAVWALEAFQVLTVTAWFDNVIIRPVLGSTSIQPGAIQTSHLSATAITGMTITGGTINGAVFNGTNWVENSSGQFLYSGTPAAGNLAASIAPVAGSDAFGNYYPQGFCVFNWSNHTYLNQQAGETWMGIFAANQPISTNQAAAINGAGYGLAISSGAPISADPDQAQIVLTGAQQSSVAPPAVAIKDTVGNTAVPLYISGPVVASDAAGNAATWKTPTMATGWATGTGIGGAYPPLQWRLLPLDMVHVFGVFHATSTTVSSIIATGFPATSGPNVSVGGTITGVNIANRVGGVYLNNTGELRVSTLGSVAVNDTFEINAMIPLGNLS